ncbi:MULTISPECIES: flagellar basal body rod protein FlgB [Arcobacteraceae]|uniref:Flagellar basal body rod protein FlgB n=1 Tax=Poseidonibacter parvus TaxID=1850254 RepID=A0A1P8KPE6_9BACT|nr:MULTISPECIES: flagellar basal body rod protein FlgB [Arcobacteraceae]APW66406.1 flagellar basal-body rod protein FlgB [Poseidonibacter parvus]
MEASNITSTLFNNLNFRAQRQNVISSNIANINTPDYKTKDVTFENELKKAQQPILKLAQTNGNHLSSINSNLNVSKPSLIEVQGLEEQNDGNNVNLDAQMSEMSKNKVLFDAVQTAIKKDSSLFRSVIESSAKN